MGRVRVERTGVVASLTVLTGLAVLVAVLGLVSGCGGAAPATEQSSSPTAAPTAGSPADQLAGLVAAAADHRYTATYQYTPPKAKTARTVAVTLANDGSWLVSVPGGALAGGRDVAVAGTAGGVYQCGLGGAGATGSSCVKVAEPGGRVPAAYDPQLESIFTTWVPALGDRQAALSIATAAPPASAPGSCFSVEPNAASLASPVPGGVYCLNTDGVVTGAQLPLGTLVLVGNPAPAPPTVTLPAAMAATGAVPTASPSPSPSPSASRSASPSPR
jgi:hypothetical protein